MPPITVTLPQQYPAQPPLYTPDQDYLTTPFLERVGAAVLHSYLARAYDRCHCAGGHGVLLAAGGAARGPHAVPAADGLGAVGARRLLAQRQPHHPARHPLRRLAPTVHCNIDVISTEKLIKLVHKRLKIRMWGVESIQIINKHFESVLVRCGFFKRNTNS